MLIQQKYILFKTIKLFFLTLKCLFFFFCLFYSKETNSKNELFQNFEAWSNLATAQARLGKKRMAYLTVKDALKCNYENWRLWENCLLVRFIISCVVSFSVNCRSRSNGIYIIFCHILLLF